MNKLVETMITGILSGVIASIIFWVIQVKIKPRFDISRSMCINQNDKGLVIGKIKIINLSKSMLMNVKYTLTYCVDYEDGLSDVSEIKPKKVPLTSLSAFSRNNTDYAVRITYEWEEKKYPLNENCRFVFTLQGTHPLSNTTKCMEVEYRKDNLKSGVFQIGRSLDFLLVERDGTILHNV